MVTHQPQRDYQVQPVQAVRFGEKRCIFLTNDDRRLGVGQLLVGEGHVDLGASSQRRATELADLHRHFFQYHLAIEDYNEAIRLDPEDAEAGLVGDHLPRADGVDVLRRERGADHAQLERALGGPDRDRAVALLLEGLLEEVAQLRVVLRQQDAELRRPGLDGPRPGRLRLGAPRGRVELAAAGAYWNWVSAGQKLEVTRELSLSTSADALLSMRWIAILYNQVKLTLAATGGIHTSDDAMRLLLAGADVTHLCAALLQNGPGYVAGILSGMERWMELYEYESVDQLKGSVCRDHASDPSAYERANYIEMLKQY